MPEEFGLETLPTPTEVVPLLALKLSPICQDIPHICAEHGFEI